MSDDTGRGPRPARRPRLRLAVLSDGSRTVAEASLRTRWHGSLVTRGSSGREPGDRADRATGEDLALARALRAMAGRLERQANGRVKHAADVRAARADRAPRRVPPEGPAPSRGKGDKRDGG